MSDETLSRTAAERLLDGGPGPERLRHVLAVAAGPAEPDELRGEQDARLAFIAAADAGLGPDPADWPSRGRARTLSRIVAAKAIAAVALTLGAGGVAVAATTNSFREGPFGGSTGQHSEPAPVDAHRTLVTDRSSGPTPRPAAEPTPPTTDSPEPDVSGGRSGSCRAGADAACGAPITTVPPSSPSRPASTPADSASAVRPPTGPNHASGDPADHTDRDVTRKQPPGQVKKNDPTTNSSGTGKVDRN